MTDQVLALEIDPDHEAPGDGDSPVSSEAGASPSPSGPTKENKARALSMRLDGVSWADIARELGVSESWAKEMVKGGRNRRLRVVRPKTIQMRRITRVELEQGRAENPDIGIARPRTRAECIDGIRPCPFVGCKYNLYLDVGDNGSIKLNFPDLEPDQMAESCVLDVAARSQGEPVEESQPALVEDDEDEPGERVSFGMANANLRFANTLEDVARALNVTRERVRQMEAKALRRLAVIGGRGALAAFRDHETSGDVAEPVHHQLPIVHRDVKPHNDSAPPPAPEVETMKICARSGCNREFRGVKEGTEIEPGKEGWCRICRLGGEPHAGPTHSGRATTEPRKAKAKPSSRAKPAARTRKVGKPAKLLIGKLPQTTTLADIVEAYELVMSVGLEVCESLAAQMEAR